MCIHLIAIIPFYPMWLINLLFFYYIAINNIIKNKKLEKEQNIEKIKNYLSDKKDKNSLSFIKNALNNNENDKAVQDLEKAISLGNNNPFFYSELGFAYENVGNLQKSLEAFEIANQKIDEYGLGSLTYNYNNIHNYFNVYINNAKHAMYESEGDH